MNLKEAQDEAARWIEKIGKVVYCVAEPAKLQSCNVNRGRVSDVSVNSNGTQYFVCLRVNVFPHCKSYDEVCIPYTSSMVFESLNLAYSKIEELMFSMEPKS